MIWALGHACGKRHQHNLFRGHTPRPIAQASGAYPAYPFRVMPGESGSFLK